MFNSDTTTSYSLCPPPCRWSFFALLYVKKCEKIIEKPPEPGSYIHLPTCTIATGTDWNSNTVMMCGKISCWQLFLLYWKSVLGSTVVVDLTDCSPMKLLKIKNNVTN